MDFSGAEWAECPKCDGQTDQTEIDAANRESIPTLVPVARKTQLPQVPEEESRPTRVDITYDSWHPPGADWLPVLIAGVFEHADRIDIESWTFPEETAA
jgi:hypothetical protein